MVVASFRLRTNVGNVLIADIPVVVGATDYNYMVTNLINGQDYQFRLYPVNRDGMAIYNFT